MSSDKSRTSGSLLRRIKAASAALAVLAVACGQWEGAHQPTQDELASRRLGATALIPADNGENSGPPPKSVRKVIVVKRIKKVVRGGGPFVICPVQAKGYYSNDFGAPRYAGGYHPHEGNDIFADFGSPIVAPFDGRAETAANRLGGLAVKVFGRDGYVYNAHLIAYGKMGEVKAGTVIGYVGNTGDAIGGPPHNHFEWHPKNGRAVNPYPYLQQVCR
ncbi:MAG: M23 family metallopeptidase [Actinomycetota bacterium]|nr:M23 family metallopeptidase [Actinomycetota bacterium]